MCRQDIYSVYVKTEILYGESKLMVKYNIVTDLSAKTTPPPTVEMTPLTRPKLTTLAPGI